MAQCDDDEASTAVAAEFVQRFNRLVLNNAEPVMKTDDSCRNELEATGRRIRTGSGAGNNCCADSLLQLMAHRGLLHARLLHDAPARTNACRLLRETLVVHDDERLRPRLRTNLGTIDASARFSIIPINVVIPVPSRA